jgi:hypothetical protein
MNNTIAVIVTVTILLLTGLSLYHFLPDKKVKEENKKLKNIYVNNPVFLSKDHDVSHGSILHDDYRSVNGLVYPYDRFFNEYPNNPWNLYKPGHVYNDKVALKHLSGYKRRHYRH